MGCDPELEAEFVASWDMMIRFYERDFIPDPNWAWLAPLRDLLVELRSHGYDRRLRAGQSLYSFIVSRSRQHGLVAGQPSIALRPNRTPPRIDVDATQRFSIALDGRIDSRLRAALDELVAQPIT